MKMPELKLPNGVVPVFEAEAQAVATRLATTVAARLRQALELADRASLAVSGGSTPVAFFEALRTQPLAWDRVDITLADERWVSEEDSASNARLVRQHLLQDGAAGARFFPLWNDAGSAEEGQPVCEQRLSGMAWPLDVVILGMGNDGHTASLFPDAPELALAMASDAITRTVVLHPPSQAQERISLTFQSLSAAKFTALHLKGRDKLATLELALSDPSNLSAMPIRGFLRPGLQVFWSP